MQTPKETSILHMEYHTCLCIFFLIRQIRQPQIRQPEIRLCTLSLHQAILQAYPQSVQG